MHSADPVDSKGCLHVPGHSEVGAKSFTFLKSRCHFVCHFGLPGTGSSTLISPPRHTQHGTLPGAPPGCNEFWGDLLVFNIRWASSSQVSLPGNQVHRLEILPGVRVLDRPKLKTSGICAHPSFPPPSHQLHQVAQPQEVQRGTICWSTSPSLLQSLLVFFQHLLMFSLLEQLLSTSGAVTIQEHPREKDKERTPCPSPGSPL